MFLERFMGATEVSCRYSMGVLWVFLKYLKDVFTCFMGVPKVLMHISMIFHWCLKVFFNRLVGCFKGVSKVFPGCF